MAAPVLGVREVLRDTQAARPPANRSARKALVTNRRHRRLTVESGIVLLTVGAFTALHQRGLVTDPSEGGGGGLLISLAPSLGCVVGALLVVRLMPPLLRAGLGRALRFRGILPLIAAARAAVTGVRPLPLIVQVVCTALFTFSLTLAATAHDGQEEGAWRVVGADARLDVPDTPSLRRLAERLESVQGVTQAVPAHVTDQATISSRITWASTRLIAVDPPAFERLLAAGPGPRATRMSGLATIGGAELPALVLTADPRLQNTSSFEISLLGVQIPATNVGPAPAVDPDGGGVVIVAAEAFTEAMRRRDIVVAPNTLWVNGPRAEEAIKDAVGAAGEVTVRREVLSRQRRAPTISGVLTLADLTAVALALFGLLGIVIAAAGAAPDRAQTFARLGILGLRSAQAWKVALGEMIPPVVVGGLGGALIGVVISYGSLGDLALNRLTGQMRSPKVVMQHESLFWLLTLLLAFLAVVVLMAVVESRLRGRRLGEMLRIG